MRSVSRRPEIMAFRGVSELTTDPPRFRRVTPPQHDDVVTVATDQDWLGQFADEQNPEPARKDVVHDLPLAAPHLKPAAAPAAEEIPAWVRRALFHWRFGPWRAIAGTIAIVLSAGLLVLATRTLFYALRGETSISAPLSAASSAPAIAAPREVPAPAVTPAPRVSSAPVVTPAPRKAAPERKAATAAAKTSTARVTPSPTPTPTRTPTATPIPTPVAAPISTLPPKSVVIPTPPPVAPTAQPSIDPGPGAASSAPTPPPNAPSEVASVRSVLDQYRRAYNTLDANAVAGVWPSVNTPSLARAFSQLESQRFIFNDCRIEVSGGRAHASCSGSASYVPKVGGRNMRTVDREWAFLLEKMSDGWVIRRADTR